MLVSRPYPQRLQLCGFAVKPTVALWEASQMVLVPVIRLTTVWKTRAYAWKDLYPPEPLATRDAATWLSFIKQPTTFNESWQDLYTHCYCISIGVLCYKNLCPGFMFRTLTQECPRELPHSHVWLLGWEDSQAEGYYSFFLWCQQFFVHTQEHTEM